LDDVDDDDDDDDDDDEEERVEEEEEEDNKIDKVEEERIGVDGSQDLGFVLAAPPTFPETSVGSKIRHFGPLSMKIASQNPEVRAKWENLLCVITTERYLHGFKFSIEENKEENIPKQMQHAVLKAPILSLDLDLTYFQPHQTASSSQEDRPHKKQTGNKLFDLHNQQVLGRGLFKRKQVYTLRAETDESFEDWGKVLTTFSGRSYRPSTPDLIAAASASASTSTPTRSNPSLSSPQQKQTQKSPKSLNLVL